MPLRPRSVQRFGVFRRSAPGDAVAAASVFSILAYPHRRDDRLRDQDGLETTLTSVRHQGIRLRPCDEVLVDDVEQWLKQYRSQLGSRQRGLSLIFRAGLWMLGQTITSPEKAELVLAAFNYGLGTISELQEGSLTFADDVILTPAQRRILELASTGATVRSIAAKLKRSPNTVKHHLNAIFREFNVRNRHELIAKLLRHR